jgi:hypothetical protein
VGVTPTTIGWGALTVTVAAADLVLSTCDVAVMITKLGLGVVAGAVYKPAAVMDPQVAPVHPAPDRAQVTAVLAALLTVAMNCCVAPVLTLAVVGETPTVTGPCVLIVSETAAALVGSPTEVAVASTEFGVGAAAGAVYVAVPGPVLTKEPHAAPVQPGPDSVHVTLGIVGPETVAESCCVAPVATGALVGVTVTEIPVEVVSVTVAAADLVTSSTETAITLTVLGTGT